MACDLFHNLLGLSDDWKQILPKIFTTTRPVTRRERSAAFHDRYEIAGLSCPDRLSLPLETNSTLS